MQNKHIVMKISQNYSIWRGVCMCVCVLRSSSPNFVGEKQTQRD